MSGSIGVAMKPGQIALTRMPSCAKRTAIERVSPSTPAFDAAYAGFDGLGDDAVDRRDADHRGVGSVRPQLRQERLHDHRVRAQVDLEQRIPRLVGEVGQVDGVGHAGRVHQPADGADGG